MKKFFTLLISFTLLFMLTACSNSPDELYGSWKSEKQINLFTNKPTTLTIAKNTLRYNKDNYKDVTYSEDDGLWTTNELAKIFGISISFSFKVIDNNTIEVFINEDKKVISKGKFMRIDQAETSN